MPPRLSEKTGLNGTVKKNVVRWSNALADVKYIPVENLHQTSKSILISRLDVRSLTKTSEKIELKIKTNFDSGA